MHFLTSFPLLSLGILITTTHPFVVIIALAADFFPFLGLVTTAASHSSNNLFAYHKMHWRILPAFSIWPLPSHFPCTSTQCITTSTLVSLCIRIASIKCSLTRTNAILKGCAPDFTTCFRTYTYEITFMTQSKCILANTLSLLISSWEKE